MKSNVVIVSLEFSVKYNIKRNLKAIDQPNIYIFFLVRVQCVDSYSPGYIFLCAKTTLISKQLEVSFYCHIYAIWTRFP